MTIRFTCECGEEIAVPDGTGGREALCPSCKKTVPVPDAGSKTDGKKRKVKEKNGKRKKADGEAGKSRKSAKGAKTKGPAKDSPPAKAHRGDADQEGPGQPEVPEAEEGASAGALLKEAIAAFQEVQEAPSDEAGDESESDEVEVVVDVEAEGVEETDKAPAPVEKDQPPESAPAAEAPASSGGDAPAAEGDEKADEPPARKPGPRESLPAEDALVIIERRKLRKALRREGEPESPAGAYEPKDVEIHGPVMKFSCRCGKRVSVPVEAEQTIGRCPKCGSRLVVPDSVRTKAGGRSPAKPRKRKPHGSGSRHRAVHDVADRMRSGAARKTGTGPSEAESPAEAKAPAAPARGWGARLAAFAIDQTAVATVFFMAVYVFETAGLGVSRWPLGAVLASAAWVGNRIVLQWRFAASVGMMVSGLRLLLADGARVPFKRTARRAAMGAAFLPLAPFALIERKGRTIADKVAGTAIVPGERSL